MEKQFVYISGDGTEKDVREMNTEYMHNAWAKANREFYSSDSSKEDREKFLNNITVLEQELKNRREKFLVESENNAN